MAMVGRVGRLWKMKKHCTSLFRVDPFIPSTISQVKQIKSLDLQKRKYLYEKWGSGSVMGASFSDWSSTKLAGEVHQEYKGTLLYLHTDASYFPPKSETCVAGIIRDPNGYFVQSFYLKLGEMPRGKGDIMEAEGIAVDTCLQRCVELCKKTLKEVDIILFCDNQNLVSLIIGDNPEKVKNSVIFPLLMNIQEKKLKFKSFWIEEIRGDGNDIAHTMAKKARNQNAIIGQYLISDLPPNKEIRKKVAAEQKTFKQVHQEYKGTLLYLHTDASYFPSPISQTCVAGIIRDPNGNFVQSFYLKLGNMPRGKGDIMEAEGIAVDTCLQRCVYLCRKRLKEVDIILFCDNQNLVSLITGDNPEKIKNSVIFPLLMKIQEKKLKFKSFKIEKISGDDNDIADTMAKKAQNQNASKGQYLISDLPPNKEIRKKVAAEQKKPPFNKQP